MCVMAHYRDGGGRENRKRAREDYDGTQLARFVHSSIINPLPTVFCSPKDSPRKRGRYSDQGSESETTEQKLESLITRVGEKVWSTTKLFSHINTASQIFVRSVKKIVQGK